MIRSLLAAAAAALLTAPALADPPTYVVELAAEKSERVYLVTGSDGASSAAVSADETSALIDPDDARARIDALDLVSVPDEQDPPVDISLFGFRLSIDGEGGQDGEDGAARITVSVGDKTTVVEAQGDEDDNGRARITLSGLDADGVGDFLDNEHLSAETRQAMLAELGLTEN